MKLKTTLTITLLLCLVPCYGNVSPRATTPENISLTTSTFTGMCEASAAVALGQTMFIVANDEDNLLRLYGRETTSAPMQVYSLAQIFADGQISDGDNPYAPGRRKVDIEGAAWYGDMIFWIGSHSISSEGERRTARESLFATKVRYYEGRVQVASEGRVYKGLLDELARVSAYDVYNLARARTIKPKEMGGLSIEGLAATPRAELLIGFRNPLRGGKVVNNRLVGGKALIVTLKNPSRVIANPPAAASFGDPIELDLGGFGIRSIEYDVYRHNYVIVAGPYDGNNETFRLYRWNGGATDQPREITGGNLAGLSPEALFFYPFDGRATSHKMQLLSDDGTNCRASAQTFRSLIEAPGQ